MTHLVSLWLLITLSSLPLYGLYIVRCEKKFDNRQIGSITYHDRKNIATMVFLGVLVGAAVVCGVMAFIKSYAIYF